MNTVNDFKKFRNEMRETLQKEFGEFACPFWGNQGANIVSISQAPSISVIRNQKPFSDKSGERLRNEWYEISDEIFYNPNNFYFTAIGMYFPGKDKKGGDKKPSFKFANRWLIQEISYLNPRLYLIIGRVAAEFFFPKQTFTDLVFNNQEINKTRTLVLPHPSPVNIKWFQDHPDFEKNRLSTVRKYIKVALQNNSHRAS
jgi:uracil-DNA glycosylase family 4